jgi:hypothetical protein
MAGVPEASASTGETVIVTATGLLGPAAAVLGVGGVLLTQFHLIDGVEAVIPAAVEPVLAALPGIIVTPDVSVSVQDTLGTARSSHGTGPKCPPERIRSTCICTLM